MKTKTLLIHITTGMLLLGNAFAGISISATAPSENIYKFQEVAPDRSPANLRFSNNTTTGWQSVGQGFSTIDAESPLRLDAISFLMIDYLSGVEGLTVRLDVYQGSTATNARPMGANATLVYTQDAALPATLSNNHYFTFALGSQLVLDTDTYYSAALSFVDQTPGSTNQGIGLGTIASGTPAISNTIGGNRWIWNGEIYSASTTNGFVMYVEATPIPEPRVLALATGLLALGLVFCRKHRRG